MNLSVLLEIYRTRRGWIILIIGLLITSVALAVYLQAVQAPRLAAVQTTALEARRGKGGVSMDAPAVYRQGLVDLAAWKQKLPVKKDFPRIVGELLALSQRDSLATGGISYTPAPISAEGLLSYTINFGVAGKYSNVKKFISDVANLRDMVVIENISLNASGMTAEYVDVKVTLTAYFRVEGQ